MLYSNLCQGQSCGSLSRVLRFTRQSTGGFRPSKLHLWMRGSRRCEEMFKDHEGRILHRSRTLEDGDTFLRDVGNDLQSDEASLPRKNGVLLTSEFSREVSSSARHSNDPRLDGRWKYVWIINYFFLLSLNCTSLKMHFLPHRQNTVPITKTKYIMGGENCSWQRESHQTHCVEVTQIYVSADGSRNSLDGKPNYLTSCVMRNLGNCKIFRFSQRCGWRSKSSGMLHRIDW